MFWPKDYTPIRQLEYWLESRLHNVASQVEQIDRGLPKNWHQIDELPKNGQLLINLSDVFKDEMGRPRVRTH